MIAQLTMLYKRVFILPSYHKLTEDLLVDIEKLADEWDDISIHERIDAREDFVEKLHHYYELFPLWDMALKLDHECSYYVIERLLALFSNPHIVYEYFSYLYKESIALIHVFYPPFTASEVRYNMSGKKKIVFLQEKASAV